MGAGSVSVSAATPAADDTGLVLHPDIAGDTQGIVVSGFNGLPVASALFLRYPQGGGAWIDALRAVAPITDATGKQTPAATLAFTYGGLLRLGLSTDVSGFQAPFMEGMLEPNRQRRLGDAPDGGSAWPVLSWSSNRQVAAGGTATQLEVDALLILYEETNDALLDHVAKVRAALAGSGVEIVRHKQLDLKLDDRGVPREHFGFSDGVSQPIPYGPGTANPDAPPDPQHGVPLGEILLGHPNAHHELAPGPIVPERLPTATAPMRGTAATHATLAQLKPSSKAAGLRDLGRNGSYLVVRELEQDVEAFNAGMGAAAAALNAKAAPDAAPVTADWVAERVIGRTKEGHLLRPGGALPPLPGPEKMPDNDALYFVADQFGLGCPLGSHVRRANPRDGLAATPDQCETLLAAANAHRILRRGRKFDGSASGDPDESAKGLLFLCLNTDIARQFEFVQQNWLFNPNFATLLGEKDPLIGPQSPFTIPQDPLRRKVTVDTFVRLRGGDYFFLPGMTALDYLATLEPAPTDGPTA